MILITRPKHEALALAEKLNQLGIASHVDPIISFGDVDNLSLKEYDQNIVCIFSSIRAVHYIEKKYKNFINLFKKATIICIGKKVQSELNKKSLTAIETYRDANDLIENFNFSKFNQNIFVISAVKHLIEFLLIALKKVNKFELVKVYKTIAALDFNKNTKDLIKAFKIDSYVVYSKFSAKVLIEILEKNDLLDMALQQKVFCLSESIQVNYEAKGI